MLSISNNLTLFKNKSQFLQTPNSASAIFDGTNDYIDASTLGSSIDKESGTISHWAKITASSNNEVLFSCSDGTSGEDKVQTVFMTSTSSGQFQAVYKAGGAAKKAVYNYPAVDIVNAGWFHLAMTYSKVETIITIKLYFNGALQNTFTGEVDTIGEEIIFDRAILGKNANADNSYLTGSIDEFAYYARALTADEILRIYNAKGTFNHVTQTDVDVTLESLKQWLRFGDGANDFASDQTACIVDMNNNSLGGELVTSETGKNINTSGVYTDVNTNANTTTGDILQVTFTVTNSSGVITLFNYFGTSVIGSSTFTDGTHIQYLQITSSSSQTDLRFYSVSGRTGTLSNISIKKVNGNAAFASGALINQDDNPTA